MPSNIFATTGTNVSVLFIDKSRADDNMEVFLVDASNLGSKVKENGNQRTVLSTDEEQQIIHTFVNQKVVDDFSVSASLQEVKERNYSLSAGQYFPVKVEYVELTPDEFAAKMDGFKAELGNLFDQGNQLEAKIKDSLKGLEYEKG